MTDILPSASYVQNREMLKAHAEKQKALQAIQQGNDEALPGAQQRIWELLETPQTVESLSRVIATEFDAEPAECETEITASLTRLYREDLIQLSPDA
jgi:Coenzyme PQQ synthesis protein D (PqqD)